MKKYRKKFEDSLEQVLKCQVSKEKLFEYFGKNSLDYQIHVNI